jgi:hypothetical protein
MRVRAPNPILHLAGIGFLDIQSIHRQAAHFKTCTHPAMVDVSEHMLIVCRKN